jgi:hypothetical protein
MMIYATATRPGSGLVAITLLCSAALFAGCSVSTRVTSTSRSSIEQRLLVRSVERAFAQVSTERLKGKTVALEVYGLTGNRDFVKELLAAQLRERGLELAGKPETGDGRLKLFITALGVDRAESLLGIPAFTAPIVGVPMPEIALFKAVRNRGMTELQFYAFDEKSQAFLFKTPLAAGKAKYDEYTLLLGINFNLDDLDEAERQQMEGEP